MRPQSIMLRQQFVRVCECGCGEPTLLANQNNPATGARIGQPLRFLHNHHGKGAQSGRWKGGRTERDDGYVLIACPNHPFASKSGHVLAHRLVVEATIGRYLRPDEVVHHRDGNPRNNEPANLQVVTSPEHTRIHATAPGWSRHHPSCISCGTADKEQHPHKARGRCRQCHDRWRTANATATDRARRAAAEKARRARVA